MNIIKRNFPELLLLVGAVIIGINRFLYHPYCMSIKNTYNNKYEECVIQGGPYLLLATLLISIALISLYKRHFRKN